VHRFTEPPDREQGPSLPRRFDFAAGEIARTLVAVGSGATYRLAGFDARARSGRLRHSNRGWPLKNNDGNTVADWVELFAPPIFEQYAPREWPHILALDAQSFAIGGQPGFHVFGAYGWDARGVGSTLALRAQPNFDRNQGVPYWAAFLHELRRRLGGGMPEQIVVGADDDIWQAIGLVWPDERGRRVAVGPLEPFAVVRNRLEHRRGTFKNRERLNRLLMLMQLDLNEQASEQRYAEVIRDELLANGGISARRRQIIDRAGASLQLYDL
jgi:hypothetical protein